MKTENEINLIIKKNIKYISLTRININNNINKTDKQ